MENPYMQYFTGETVFQKRPPINPADFSKFRKRIGKEGAEKLFRLSLMVNAKEMTRKELKALFMNHPTRHREGAKAVRRMRTIARAMVNDLSRKLASKEIGGYGSDIALYLRVINQERTDTNKIYSLH